MASFEKLDRLSPLAVGLVQALGVVLYVGLFAVLVGSLESKHISVPPFIGIAFFLIAFVFSAIVCGGLILAYPTVLALRGKVRRALKIIGWSGIAFLLLLAPALLILFL
jgi:hypothetical protein